ncbi:MAG: hypothetical protein M1828_002227 [Chrysothrix sp. TS-e1954]|nr:MAG: hypothetical protein M1828_002227 [Chrysothrix sp. TS-e1954]
MISGKSLVGKNAVVTGAGRGIGRAIVLAFVAAGANVACVARTQSELDDIVAESRACRSYSGMCIAIAADVAGKGMPAFIYTRVLEQLGNVDILVNNAGITKINTLEHEQDFESWWRVLEVNLKGPAALVHQVLPRMLAQRSGTVISIGSRNAAINMPFATAYSASKTALLRFHQCLEREIEGRGVSTFVLEPGDVATTLAHGSSVIDLDTVTKVPALCRMLEQTIGTCATSPQVVAEMCVKLALDESFQCLSGLYIHAEHNFSELLEDVQKQGLNSRVRSQQLHELKVDEL